MLSRYRLFKLLSSPHQFPPQFLTLNCTILASTKIFSPHSPKQTITKTNSKCNLYLQNTLFSLPIKENRRKAQKFCTHATEEKEAESSSMFSPYLSVRVFCDKNVAETLSEALLCFGASSTSMDELDWHGNPDDIWITSMFTADQDVHTCVSHAADSIGLNYIPKFEFSTENLYDWQANIQETFHPTKIIDGLWIIPKWNTPLDSEAINIIIDPGLAFGTGDHPTTKLCLLHLHDWIKGGEHFFDYGTGSGVLGIAALKMGAAFSIGIDVDPEAVTSAHQNFVLNEIDSSKMQVYLVASNSNLEEQTLKLVASKEKFDIVVANILLNPLIDLAEDIVSFGKSGALIGLTGILSEQVQQIKDLYSKYLENILISEIDGWAFLYGTRKKKDLSTLICQRKQLATFLQKKDES